MEEVISFFSPWLFFLNVASKMLKEIYTRDSVFRDQKEELSPNDRRSWQSFSNNFHLHLTAPSQEASLFLIRRLIHSAAIILCVDLRHMTVNPAASSGSGNTTPPWRLNGGWSCFCDLQGDWNAQISNLWIRLDKLFYTFRTKLQILIKRKSLI